jgi:phosphoribosyl 1,2-cyclic phosphodiesterase
MSSNIDEASLRVRFWGTRGSYPMPGPTTLRFGGNTTCVEIRAGSLLLIIDAGTGIINLGHDLLRRALANGNAPITATLLLTHTHHDHTQGLPYFGPAYLGSSRMYIFGPRACEGELNQTLRYAVLPPSFPISLDEMPTVLAVRSLGESETIVFNAPHPEPHVLNIHHDQIAAGPDTLQVRVFRTYAHPRHGALLYRISWRGKSLVFASDTEGYVDTDQRLVQFACDTDLLIHDAQYSHTDYLNSKQGWGHSTPQMACAVARQCGAKQLVLTHHEPLYDDATIAALEQEAQAIFPATQAAYEGLELVL